MWTEIWENIDQEIIDALTITGKGEFKLLPKDQFEAIYKYRFIVYSGDTFRNRFHIILEDNIHIVYAIKNLKFWLSKLVDHTNWAKITKTIATTDAGSLTLTTGSGSSTSTDKAISSGFSKGDNTSYNNQRIKSGYTDANSLGDEESNKKFVTVTKKIEDEQFPIYRGFNASHQLNDNQLNDIGLQVNNVINNTESTSSSNTTGLSKNTNKADSVQLIFSTADDLIKIINMKIPELRRFFFSKFDPLFLPVSIN